MEMKSSTINKIMLGTIAVLFVICIVLVLKIKTRPRMAAIEDAAAALGMEQTEEVQENVTQDETVNAEKEKKQVVVTTSRVNVRDIDSEDGKVLTTVEAGAEFDFVEVLGNGWTKIIYEGQEAYIISECITLREVEENVQETTASDDYEENSTSEDVINSNEDIAVEGTESNGDSNSVETPVNEENDQEQQPAKLDITEVTPQ